MCWRGYSLSIAPAQLYFAITLSTLHYTDNIYCFRVPHLEGAVAPSANSHLATAYCLQMCSPAVHPCLVLGLRATRNSLFKHFWERM